MRSLVLWRSGAHQLSRPTAEVLYETRRSTSRTILGRQMFNMAVESKIGDNPSNQWESVKLSQSVIL